MEMHINSAHLFNLNFVNLTQYSHFHLENIQARQSMGAAYAVLVKRNLQTFKRKKSLYIYLKNTLYVEIMYQLL